MDRLLDSGHCNINEIYHGRTPLHQSVETLRWEDSDATALHRLLAQPGIDLLGGQHAVLGTPLHLAAYGAYHDNKAVEILLTAGADPSVAANVVILGDSIPPEVLCPYEIRPGMLFDVQPIHVAAYFMSIHAVAPLMQREPTSTPNASKASRPL